MTTETIQEFTTAGGRVDHTAGIIRGVKILQKESRNGRTYTEAAMRDAAPLYEGAKVNVNHPKGSATGPRDYFDRLGSLRNVRYVGGALEGDLHCNPKHPAWEPLAWAAEHAPNDAGLSHNAEANVSRASGRQVVEAITKVHSVDLVADPATNRGLYEHVESDGHPLDDPATFAAAMRGDLRSSTFAEEVTGRPNGESVREWVDGLGREPGTTESAPAPNFARALRSRS